jgi:hypothetical protein
MGNVTDVMFCLQTQREGKRRRRGSDFGVHDHRLHGLHLRGDSARDQVRDDPVRHHGRRVLRRREVGQQVSVLLTFEFPFIFAQAWALFWLFWFFWLSHVRAL